MKSFEEILTDQDQLAVWVSSNSRDANMLKTGQNMYMIYTDHCAVYSSQSDVTILFL